jgi:hypothetical protein
MHERSDVMTEQKYETGKDITVLKECVIGRRHIMLSKEITGNALYPVKYSAKIRTITKEGKSGCPHAFEHGSEYIGWLASDSLQPAENRYEYLRRLAKEEALENSLVEYFKLEDGRIVRGYGKGHGEVWNGWRWERFSMASLGFEDIYYERITEEEALSAIGKSKGFQMELSLEALKDIENVLSGAREWIDKMSETIDETRVSIERAEDDAEHIQSVLETYGSYCMENLKVCANTVQDMCSRYPLCGNKKKDDTEE